MSHPGVWIEALFLSGSAEDHQVGEKAKDRRLRQFPPRRCRPRRRPCTSSTRCSGRGAPSWEQMRDREAWYQRPTSPSRPARAHARGSFAAGTAGGSSGLTHHSWLSLACETGHHLVRRPHRVGDIAEVDDRREVSVSLGDLGGGSGVPHHGDFEPLLQKLTEM